jgi:hypothetical protein
MTTRCSIDPDPGRNPPPNPTGRPSLGASASAGHGNPVAHTHTDSWHTASTIDDQPYTVRGAPAAPQRRRVMNRRLERRLDLVPQKCAKSVCLSSISRITHVSDTGRPERDDVLVAAVDGGSAGRRPSRRCGEAMPSDGFPAVDRPGTRCCGRGQASSRQVRRSYRQDESVWRFLAWWVHAAVASGCQTRCPEAFHGVLAAVILTPRYEGLGLGRDSKQPLGWWVTS